jgi:hypothetical protein
MIGKPFSRSEAWHATRGALPVLRNWSGAAFLGFGGLLLLGHVPAPGPLPLGDTILGLHLWAALVALGGGLLLFWRRTAPYALGALGLALAAAVGTSYALGGSWDQLLPFGVLALTLGTGLAHFLGVRRGLQRQAAWDAVAAREMARPRRTRVTASAN